MTVFRCSTLGELEAHLRDELAQALPVWRQELAAHGLDEAAITRAVALLERIMERRRRAVLAVITGAIAADDGVRTLPLNAGLDEARDRAELAALADLLHCESAAVGLAVH